MCLALTFLCNSHILVVDVSYSYLYFHDLYPVVSNIDFMINLLCYYIFCMVRQSDLVYLYMFQYLNVCSSMMSVHPKGGGSAWYTRVSLTSVDMVSGLVKCCWMSPFPTVCRGSMQVVTDLFFVIVIIHVQLGGRRFIKCCDGQTIISAYHLHSSPCVL